MRPAEQPPCLAGDKPNAIELDLCMLSLRTWTLILWRGETRTELVPLPLRPHCHTGCVQYLEDCRPTKRQLLGHLAAGLSRLVQLHNRSPQPSGDSLMLLGRALYRPFFASELCTRPELRTCNREYVAKSRYSVSQHCARFDGEFCQMCLPAGRTAALGRGVGCR